MICGTDAGSKLQKANDLGVKVNFDSYLADSKGNFVDGVFNHVGREFFAFKDWDV